LEDQFVINYRFQGLAEKKPETQETVPVKRTKLRVRSKRVLSWIGFGETIRSRGFLGKGQDTRNKSNSYRKGQGPYCKITESSSSFRPAHRSFYRLQIAGRSGDGGLG
jgi:hypothetical protein